MADAAKAAYKGDTEYVINVEHLKKQFIVDNSNIWITEKTVKFYIQFILQIWDISG